MRARSEGALLWVGKWEGFQSLVHNFLRGSTPWAPACLFRGQSNSAWSLKPTVARMMGGASFTEVKAFEQEAFNRFRSEAHQFVQLRTFDDLDHIFEWWPLMQHYRAPTRLLDWTKSLYVALYFAVRDGWDEKTGSDGAIWFFQSTYLRASTEDVFPPSRYVNKKGHFTFSDDDLFSRDTPPLHFAFKDLYGDERVSAQQGQFTFCLQPLQDQAPVLGKALEGYEGGDHFGKVVIPRELKPGFLYRLLDMNIGAHTLFPGMDGIGQSIVELAQLHRIGIDRIPVVLGSSVKAPSGFDTIVEDPTGGLLSFVG